MKIAQHTPTNYSEERIQQNIIVWWNNNYPEYRGLLCYNNNNSEGSYRGYKNKFLGVVKGRSDLTLYFNGTAAMIELKTSTGKQSKAQKDWQEKIEAQGFEYIIIRSLEEFQKMVKQKIAIFELL